jgi:hypothetical protein
MTLPAKYLRVKDAPDVAAVRSAGGGAGEAWSYHGYTRQSSAAITSASMPISLTGARSLLIKAVHNVGLMDENIPVGDNSYRVEMGIRVLDSGLSTVKERRIDNQDDFNIQVGAIGTVTTNISMIGVTSLASGTYYIQTFVEFSDNSFDGFSHWTITALSAEDTSVDIMAL